MDTHSKMQSNEPGDSAYADDLLIPHDIGIVGRLFQADVDVLSEVLKTTRNTAVISLVQRIALTRALQSLSLWGESHHVSSGSLDATLQRSRKLLRATLLPLKGIGVLLLQSRSKDPNHFKLVLG